MRDVASEQVSRLGTLRSRRRTLAAACRSVAPARARRLELRRRGRHGRARSSTCCAPTPRRRSASRSSPRDGHGDRRPLRLSPDLSHNSSTAIKQGRHAGEQRAISVSGRRAPRRRVEVDRPPGSAISSTAAQRAAVRPGGRGGSAHIAGLVTPRGDFGAQPRQFTNQERRPGRSAARIAIDTCRGSFRARGPLFTSSRVICRFSCRDIEPVLAHDLHAGPVAPSSTAWSRRLDARVDARSASRCCRDRAAIGERHACRCTHEDVMARHSTDGVVRLRPCRRHDRRTRPGSFPSPTSAQD